MKIFGIGTDIVKISRIKKSIKKKNFISKLFSQNEISKCKKTKNFSNCFAKLQLKKHFPKH